MESNVLLKRWVQGSNVVVDDLRGTMFTGENGAHTFQISGVDSAQETVEITGTITGRFLTATNVTVPLTGTVSGGVASLTLTEDCYVIPGRFVLSIYATNGSTTQCIYCAVGNVFRTQSDIIEYPSASIPDIEQIIADAQAAVTQINAEVTDAQAAVAAAQTAVDGIEAQRQTMIESIASVAGQGTDTTLSQSGVAADAKATGDQVRDLKSAINNEPFIISSYVQGARGANAAITTRSDRCTTDGVYALSAGDKISITNPTQCIAVIACVANNSFIYDSGWQSGNYTYTVTEQTAGTYFVNFAYSISGENLSPSDLVGVQVSIDRITAISQLVDDVAELKGGLPSVTGVNIIPSVPWERGGIIDGVDSSMDNRVRSDYIDVTDVDHIIYSINTNYRIYYCLYKSDKTFISNSEWLTGENTVEFSEDVKYIRFVIGLVNNNDCGCEVTRQLSVTAYYVIEHDVADLYSQYNSLADLDEINLKSWVIGYIYRGGGVDTREQPNYVCTPTMQKFPFDISISVDSGYQFVVLTFDDSGVVTFGTTWLQDTYIIHADTWFCLNLAKTTPEAVTNVSAYTSKIHIRSKAVENASSPASGLKISVLGDSISTYTGWIETGVNAAHYPKYDVTDVSQMWWHIVADALGALDGLTISAISQSAYYDYGNSQYPPMYDTVRITRLGNSGAPDMVLIYAGVNDGFTEQNGNISYEYNVTALEALANSTVRGIELTIRKIQVAYPSAKIVIMIPQQVKMSDMPTRYDLERVNKIADEITACADLFGVWKIIDLRKCGINQTNVASFCGDGNIHPNVMGMRRIADYVLEQLR